MKRLFPLVLIVLTAGLSSLRAADAVADDKALRDVAGRFFAAFASKDMDAFMALGSEESPEYVAHKKIMAELYGETGPIQVKSLSVVRVSRDSDTASMRVAVELTGYDATTGEPHPALDRRYRVIELVLEGRVWKVVHYGASDRRLTELLTVAKT